MTIWASLLIRQMLYIKIFLYFLHKIFAYRAVRWIRSQVVKIHVSARCELMGVKMSACELAAIMQAFFFPFMNVSLISLITLQVLLAQSYIIRRTWLKWLQR